MELRRWRSLQELRDAYAASGLELAKKAPECRGKIRYRSREDADRHCADLAANDESEHAQRRARLNVYPCRWCQGYHVGHATKERTQAKPRRRGYYR
jgi:hypothetical protein